MHSNIKLKLLPENPQTGGAYDGDGMCCCPVCAHPYHIADANCEHFVGDWCFTADYERGSPKGQWATGDGNDLLTQVCAAMETLQELLDNDEVQPESRRLSVIAILPKGLRHSLDSFQQILQERVVSAPGYLGTTELITESMASDAWSVHWAINAATAARVVETQFSADLAHLMKALDLAQRESASTEPLTGSE